MGCNVSRREKIQIKLEHPLNRLGTGFEDKHFIRADGRTIAIEIVRSDATAETLYLHRDHLGSVDAITDAGGNLDERYSYDAFGKRRQLAWTPDTADALLYSTIQIEDRGYTGHDIARSPLCGPDRTRRNAVGSSIGAGAQALHRGRKWRV